MHNKTTAAVAVAEIAQKKITTHTTAMLRFLMKIPEKEGISIAISEYASCASLVDIPIPPPPPVSCKPVIHFRQYWHCNNLASPKIARLIVKIFTRRSRTCIHRFEFNYSLSNGILYIRARHCLLRVNDVRLAPLHRNRSRIIASANGEQLLAVAN